jgi:hypothetical protein
MIGNSDCGQTTAQIDWRQDRRGTEGRQVLKSLIGTYPHWPKQVRYAWLEFGLRKSLGGAPFAKPAQSADEEFTVLEFMPYLVWYLIRHGYSKLREMVRRK